MGRFWLKKGKKAQKIGEEVGPSGGENGWPLSLAEVYGQAAFAASLSMFFYIGTLGDCQEPIFLFFEIFSWFFYSRKNPPIPLDLAFRPIFA